ncbi:MAG: MBL fold metallo-hydrolase [Treponema sp.]|nr:MBL fold metallo-hydrolase [Treponema sp.]
MMKMLLLGTGTSHGVPCIACKCSVCTSKDEHDKRFRCSAYVTSSNKIDGYEPHLLVDIGPDFRSQALKYDVCAVDAVLLTHSHADHLHGLDDIRIFSHTISSSHLTNPNKGKETEGNGLPFYTNTRTIRDLKNRFDYVFKETQLGGGKPKIRLEDCAGLDESQPKEFGDIRVLPIPMLHGTLEVTGWLFSSIERDGKYHSIAYLTDVSKMPDSSIQKIRENAGILDHVVIDGLRKEEHSTHFSFKQAMQVCEQLEPKHSWFTHMSHNNSHNEIIEYAKKEVENFPRLKQIVLNGGSVLPAYDSLVICTEF